MERLRLKFSKSFLLKDFENCPEGKGIYFHYIKDNGSCRIIYVGECLSFPLRQKDHYIKYDNFRYSLFEIENGELNIKFVPDYDLPEKFICLKDELIDKIYVTCGEVKEQNDCSLKEVEGAIINCLYRKSETRKFLLNTKTNYRLRNKVILLEGLDVILCGLTTMIETPAI